MPALCSLASSLQSLQLGYNPLTGPLPEEVGMVGTLSHLSLLSTSMTAPGLTDSNQTASLSEPVSPADSSAGSSSNSARTRMLLAAAGWVPPRKLLKTDLQQQQQQGRAAGLLLATAEDDVSSHGFRHVPRSRGSFRPGVLGWLPIWKQQPLLPPPKPQPQQLLEKPEEVEQSQHQQLLQPAWCSDDNWKEQHLKLLAHFEDHHFQQVWAAAFGSRHHRLLLGLPDSGRDASSSNSSRNTGSTGYSVTASSSINSSGDSSSSSSSNGGQSSAGESPDRRSGPEYDSATNDGMPCWLALSSQRAPPPFDTEGIIYEDPYAYAARLLQKLKASTLTCAEGFGPIYLGLQLSPLPLDPSGVAPGAALPQHRVLYSHCKQQQ